MPRVVLDRGGNTSVDVSIISPAFSWGNSFLRFPAPANRDTWPRSVTRAETVSEEGVSRASGKRQGDGKRLATEPLFSGS